MSSAKERHYWSQLRSALTAGQWLASLPATAPNGSQLSWSELFRKFNKHCKGFADVSEIALPTYSLAYLLSSISLNEDEDYGHTRDFSVELGNECTLPTERMQEAEGGYEALKRLGSANLDSVHFALAYFAYALSRPWDCLTHLAKIPDFSQIQSFIPATGTAKSSTSNLLTVPMSGGTSASSSLAGGFSSFADPTVAEVKDGRGWALTETFRSLCLQGMCHERLHPEDPKEALKAYRSALPAFRTLTSPEFASITSAPARLPTGKPDYTPFVQLRELWRWVERLLWRAICLSSRTSNVHASQDEESDEDSLWMWLEKYTVCSASWPPNFRSEHRATISSIYLRALVLRHRNANQSSGEFLLSGSPLWLHTARSVIQDYRAILTVNTKFPRAGQMNVKVEEFVDLCVSVWEASGCIGERSGWVIDILWWATRLTFNSSRVLRHMTRLFYLSGDADLAKRSLRLYVQVVSKACQASKQGAGESIDPNDNDSQINTDHEGYLEDTDTDEHWVETLLFGARMLCKLASVQPGLQDIEDVKEAKQLIPKAIERMRSDEDFGKETRLSPWRRIKAEAALAEGVCDSLLALKGQDPYTRPALLASAHSQFLKSVSLYPTAAAHFHLSLSYARYAPHCDLEEAIRHAGLAVEANPKDVRYWHLLGVLLSAVEKWDESAVVLEHGAELDMTSESKAETDTQDQNREEEEDAMNEQEEEDTSRDRTPIGDANGDSKTLRPVHAEGSIRTERQRGDFALRIHVNGDHTASTPDNSSPTGIEYIGVIPTTVLAADATFIPPAGNLLGPIFEAPSPPSKQEMFEWGLQLRMTQMALMEVRKGPEGAEEGWLDVFGWIAENKGLTPTTNSGAGTEGQPQQSFDGGRRSMDLQMSQISVTGLNAVTVRSGGNIEEIDIEVSISSSISNSELAPPPIPITISPASPDVGLPAPQGEENPTFDMVKRSSSSITEKKGGLNGFGRRRRSSSLDRGDRDKDKSGDTSKSKKMQQMLKNRVQKGQMKITAVGRRIGHEITKNGSLRRSSSTPDFHAVLQQTSYQASSIHSRRRLSSIIQSRDGTPTESPTPPPPAPSPVPPSGQGIAASARAARERKLLSDLWLMSAATFRRLGKIEQAKGAIQEAEVKDEHNPAVWVQLALYYVALGHHQHAISTLQKALFIDPDDVPATVHLSRLYLTPPPTTSSPYANVPTNAKDSNPNSGGPSSTDVDLAAGLLTQLSKGRGWDVPEVWYYLAKAWRLQRRKGREGEALEKALGLAEGRGVREIGAAIGLCI